MDKEIKEVKDMPFKSSKQRKYLYSQKQEVAKKFESHMKKKKKSGLYARQEK